VLSIQLIGETAAEDDPLVHDQVFICQYPFILRIRSECKLILGLVLLVFPAKGVTIGKLGGTLVYMRGGFDVACDHISFRVDQFLD